MRYLSAEWFAAAQEAVERNARLRELSADLDVTLEQTVTSTPDGETVRWHVVFDHGRATLQPGPAPDADLRFATTYDVARAVAVGELAASIAFVRGELTIGGDLNLLITHQRTLAALDDVLHDVRAATTYA